jgi:hypothetical protein
LNYSRRLITNKIMRLSSQSNVSTNKYSQAESTQSALEVKLRSNKTKSAVKIQLKELD